MRSKDRDTEYEEGTIVAVEPKSGHGWGITWKPDGEPPEWTGGLGFLIPDKGVTPTVGARARFYGRGVGSVVRGVDIDGREVFYRTERQQDALDRRRAVASDRRKQRNFARDRADHDRRIAALPPEFVRRFTGFASRRTDWRWQFEGYELMVCEDAVRIAVYLADTPDEHAAARAFHDLAWTEQLAAVPGLNEGHSGNSFGQACGLGLVYATEPQHVERMHGALCPLVGCSEYGCWAASDEATATTTEAAS